MTNNKTSKNVDTMALVTYNHNLLVVAPWFVIKSEMPSGSYTVKKETEKAVLLMSTSYSIITVWVPKSVLKAA